MFDLPILQLSAKVSSGPGQWFAEWVATFGLVVTILATLKAKPSAVAVAVGLYITAAYWFTASTSFANPAVTIARAFSDTFAGIRLADVAPFVLAQLVGALSALAVCRWLLENVTPSKCSCGSATRGIINEYHHLSQPRMRHLTQHAGHDPRSGAEPEVIEYLKTPPTRERLSSSSSAMGIAPRDLLAPEGHALRRARP